MQRVSSASVTVEGRITGKIENGILVLAGCAKGDTDEDFRWIARKVSELRIFGGESGHFDLSVKDVGGSILVVSQFTLLGDARKGRRPSFSDAMPVDEARAAFDRFVVILKETGLSVEQGEFQATMDVESVNHGPVTLIIDSR